MTAGFRIFERQRKVSGEVVQKFSSIPVANISDSMSRMNAAGSQLRPLHQGGSSLVQQLPSSPDRATT
ncbi:dimethylmenaquinone methyltransferase family protein [Collimonas pratensis]|uniref:Dimethylmenaquinone methyltransferase family protein n=1 Tax=Collimonas pratensis TaxID=279113 RepID=A0A127PYH3_9BURK|nr:dimethylmenaquinone methyltransferase family protein [Collimonas pratensis]